LYPRRGVSQVDVVNEAYIEQKYKIPGRAYRDFATLRGDPSDGLPGVKGVGEKLAATLVARYGSLDGIIAAIEAGEESVALNRVRRDLDYVGRAIKVVTIPTDLPIPEVQIVRPRQRPGEEVFELADRYGLGGATRRLVAVLTGQIQS
jgi:5'-3' exonuclease